MARTYFCVVKPTPAARNGIGAVYGCSTDRAKAEAAYDRAKKRGMDGLTIAVRKSLPRGTQANQWLSPTDGRAPFDYFSGAKRRWRRR